MAQLVDSVPEPLYRAARTLHGRLRCVHGSCSLLTMTTNSILVTSLLQELARLLAEPLRPGFSQKYFTGGAAGAAAMLLSSGGAAAGPDAKPGDSSFKSHHQQCPQASC